MSYWAMAVGILTKLEELMPVGQGLLQTGKYTSGKMYFNSLDNFSDFCWRLAEISRN